MKLIEVGPDPLGEYPRRVVVEHANGKRETFVGDVLAWLNEATGEEPSRHTASELGRLLWLHDREQLRRKKETEERERRDGAVPPAERGTFLQGIVDKLSGGKPSASMQARVDAFKAEQETAAPALPPELEEDLPHDTGLRRREAERGQLPWWFRKSPLEAPRATGRELATGGIVIDDPHPFPRDLEFIRSRTLQEAPVRPPEPPEGGGAAAREDKHALPPMVLRRAVAVALIESPLDLALCRERGGLTYLPAGTPFVHLDPEVSDEGLRLLQVAIEGEQAKRAGGDS